MAELSLEGLFGIGEAIGIMATLFVILYFSRKQMQSLSVDIKTKVLNDLDEKVHKMVEIIVEKPSMEKVVYKELERPSDERAFAFYVLFICSHAHTMHQRKVLTGDEWTGWVQWMRSPRRDRRKASRQSLCEVASLSRLPSPFSTAVLSDTINLVNDGCIAICPSPISSIRFACNNIFLCSLRKLIGITHL